MEKPCHIVHKDDTQNWARQLAKNGQALLPMVELIEQSGLAIDELIDVLGRAHVEAVLHLSAESVAGPRHPGKKGGEIGWDGREEGTACLRERKLRVERPRLRQKGRGRDQEVAFPFMKPCARRRFGGQRMLEILRSDSPFVAPTGGRPPPNTAVVPCTKSSVGTSG